MKIQILSSKKNVSSGRRVVDNKKGTQLLRRIPVFRGEPGCVSPRRKPRKLGFPPRSPGAHAPRLARQPLRMQLLYRAMSPKTLRDTKSGTYGKYGTERTVNGCPISVSTR